MNNKFKILVVLIFSFFVSINTVFINTVFSQDLEVQSENSLLTDLELKIYNLVSNAPIYTPSSFSVTTTETELDYGNVYEKNKQTIFQNTEDTYNIYRFYFKENSEERFTRDLQIIGDEITIRYINPETKQWVNTSNLDNLMNTTLFIDTDSHSYVVSVGAVYKDDFSNNTLTIVPEEERIVHIEKRDGYFNIQFSFPINTALIGEYWVLSSSSKLVDWSTQKSFDDLLSHDLSIERRWSYDGYYFPTPYNYEPGGENVLYRHPSNYTGASWVKYATNNLAKYMGYVMTETCMQNQNQYGFWETGPKSLWLEEDFNIGYGFYDTRFNSDFATSLLYAYQNYNVKEFLASAIRYAEYFLEYVNSNSYKVTGGGILVQDYAHPTDSYEHTHISLNHQLAEINFLYRLYLITNEQTYYDLAEQMLLGIENTRNKWVLEDNNLNYSLYYNKNTNLMVDYPYLTYNDLYETKSILSTYFSKTSDAIEFLIAAKKQWMDSNGVTGYLGYES